MLLVPLWNALVGRRKNAKWFLRTSFRPSHCQSRILLVRQNKKCKIAQHFLIVPNNLVCNFYKNNLWYRCQAKKAHPIDTLIAKICKYALVWMWSTLPKYAHLQIARPLFVCSRFTKLIFVPIYSWVEHPFYGLAYLFSVKRPVIIVEVMNPSIVSAV